MTTSFKFLGVVLDPTLSFERHYHEVHQRLSRACYVIGTMSKFLPLDCIRTMYFAYFLSHLVYCLLLWFPLLSNAHKNFLVTLQKKIVRLVCKVPIRSHCMPLFKREEILTIKDQLLVDNVKLMWRVTNELCPTPVLNIFKGDALSILTRCGGVRIQRHKSAKSNKSFLCKPVIECQRLSREQKSITNLKLFVKKTKKSLLQNYWSYYASGLLVCVNWPIVSSYHYRVFIVWCVIETI